VEVSEGRIKDAASGHPGAFLLSIAFPVNKVLEASSTASRSDELTKSVGWCTVDEPGGWRGYGGGLKRTHGPVSF
jgi:hypothetical protein